MRASCVDFVVENRPDIPSNDVINSVLLLDEALIARSNHVFVIVMSRTVSRYTVIVILLLLLLAVVVVVTVLVVVVVKWR